MAFSGLKGLSAGNPIIWFMFDKGLKRGAMFCPAPPFKREKVAFQPHNDT
jgi:hypothetical protein